MKRQLTTRNQQPTTAFKAFSLIELLVVIAVMALLMSILHTALHRARKQARSVVCQSNLRQWGVMFKTYLADSEGKRHFQGSLGAGIPELWMHWLTQGRDATERIRYCPEAKTPADPTEQPMVVSHKAVGGAFTAWGNIRPIIRQGKITAQSYSGSYGINSFHCAVPDPGSPVIGMDWKKPAEVKKWFWGNKSPVTRERPERVPVFVDSLLWVAWPKHTDSPPPTATTHIEFPCGCSDSIRRFCMNRHNGTVNAVFLDGSSRRVGLKELWTLKWSPQFDTRGPWTRAGGVRPEDWPEWMRHLKDY